MNIHKCILFNTGLLAFLSVSLLGSCKKNYSNPNAAGANEVFTSPNGIMGVAIGVQQTYSRNVTRFMADVNGLTTKETFVVNVGNLSETQLQSGGPSVDNNNAILNAMWNNAAKTVYDADNVLRAANNLEDRGFASGLIGYASIFKALSMGVFYLYYQNVPDSIGDNHTPTTFIPREQGLLKIINLINSALAIISSNPISSDFLNSLPEGMDVINTLNALKARFSLYAGDYSNAISAVNSVDLSKAVTFDFDPASPNPIFQTVTSTNNVYQPIDSTLGLPTGLRPDLTDQRIPFYTTINSTINPRFRLNGFWNSATKGIPVYFPGEMRLIKAESLLRQSSPDIPQALDIINDILKKSPSGDPLGIGANISAGFTGSADVNALLTEIYRNRCIEMFHSGLKLEDMRRFNRPENERGRNFFPYPLDERNNNPNLPADPPF